MWLTTLQSKPKDLRFFITNLSHLRLANNILGIYKRIYENTRPCCNKPRFLRNSINSCLQAIHVWPSIKWNPHGKTFRTCAFGHQRWQGLTCQPGNDFCPPLGLGLPPVESTESASSCQLVKTLIMLRSFEDSEDCCVHQLIVAIYIRNYRLVCYLLVP